jgi:hypothetical protein
MNHLINQYSRFLGEVLHLKMNFLNSLFRLPHFQNLALKYLFHIFSDYFKNQLNKNFCWFFFVI